MDKRIQAKHVSARAILEFLDTQPPHQWTTHRPTPEGCKPSMPSIGDLPEMRDVPPRVLLAKLRAMRERGWIDGCPCGCRGDWTIRTPGSVALREGRVT